MSFEIPDGLNLPIRRDCALDVLPYRLGGRNPDAQGAEQLKQPSGNGDNEHGTGDDCPSTSGAISLAIVVICHYEFYSSGGLAANTNIFSRRLLNTPRSGLSVETLSYAQTAGSYIVFDAKIFSRVASSYIGIYGFSILHERLSYPMWVTKILA